MEIRTTRTSFDPDAEPNRLRWREASRTAIVAVAAALVLSASPVAANNNVLMGLVLLDAAPAPVVYDLQLDVQLDDVPGVSGVTVSIGGSDYPAALDNGTWNVEGLRFTTLAALQQALHGTWTITVSGTSPSVSTFDLDANGLSESDFLDPPSGLVPSHGATDVSPRTDLRWTPPTGGAAAYVLVASVGSRSQDQEAFSLMGDITVDADQWQPPDLLEAGRNEFDVFYVNPAPDRITNLVDDGNITWGSNGFAPQDYPEPRPLLALASETRVTFTVSVTEDFEGYALQNDTLGVVQPGDGTVYYVRDQGAPVASVGEVLASSAGVADDGGSRYWTLGSSAGETGSIGGTEGFLLIGDLPANDDSTPGAGIFSDYFATPRPVSDLQLSARVRKDSGEGNAQVRLLLGDGTNEIATPKSPVSSEFSEIAAGVDQFTELVDSPFFDFDQVERVSLEFFVDPIPGGPVATGAFAFGVDDVKLPEPGGPAPQLAVVAALGVVAWRRRARG